MNKLGTLLALWLLSGHALAATINVTTTSDEFNTGTGCSLREAVQAANTNSAFGGCPAGSGTDTINVPNGFHTLSRGNFGSFTDIDEDANSVIDIDIASNLNIVGTASATVSIGNTSGNYRGRIFHVVSGTVTFTNITIRDGLNPTGRFGGGIRTNPGTNVTLTGVRVTLCSADGGAGGVLNEGTMVLNNSQIDNNVTTNAIQGGGGIYSAAGSLTLNDSRIFANRTEGGASGEGAGIYNESDSTLVLDNTLVSTNTVANSVINGRGGGIFTAGPAQIIQSTILNNQSDGDFPQGGGLYCTGSGNLLVDLSLVRGNDAANGENGDESEGGGIYTECVTTVRDSVIDANSAEYGGGIDGFGYDVLRSTISNNHAQFDCGGISGQSNVTNTTIVNNLADSDGGGLCAGGTITSSTITGNQANADNLGGGVGGGIYAIGFLTTFRNSVIADNLDVGVGNEEDCHGAIQSFGNTLVGNTTGCNFSAGATDQVNVAAGLAALAVNGGPSVGEINNLASMQTRLPQPGSLLVDRGNASGCRDPANVLLNVDQVGNVRAADGPDPDTVATCDIGAMELPAVVIIDPIFANGLE